jgi:flagellar protein FliO/FliZ
MRFTLITAGLLLATRAAAADGSLDAAGSLVQMLLGLAVVIGLLYASLHVLKRLGAGTGNAAGLQGARHRRRPPRRVVLVDVAGKVLVLGVTPGRITPCTPSTPPTCPARRTTPPPPARISRAGSSRPSNGVPDETRLLRASRLAAAGRRCACWHRCRCWPRPCRRSPARPPPAAAPSTACRCRPCC